MDWRLIMLVCGALFWPTLFFLFVNILYSTSYRILGKGEILEISNRLTSSVQALAACTVGMITVSTCSHDIIHDRNEIVDVYSLFGVSYFLYDTWCMYYVFKHMRAGVWGESVMRPFLLQRGLYVVHHLAIGLLGFPVILLMRNGLGDYFCGCLFLTEASAPFVSFRAVLSLLNLKDTRMYKVNGAVMIIVFFVCRIALFPFMYWSYSIYADIAFFQVMLSIPKKCNFGCVLILSLQIYWWGIMLVGAHKVLKNATSKQSNENQGKPKLS